MANDDLDELIELAKRGPEPIGVDPKTGKNIYCLVGRYGPYVQLGEQVEGEDKPKRGSLPKHLTPQTITEEEALEILSLPRELGVHPDTQKPILANNGRFGPYVMHDGDFRSLKKDDDLHQIDLKRALEILSEEKKGRRGAKIVKEFEKYKKKKLAVYDGKYGLYIKHGTKNISIPEDLRKTELVEKWTNKEVEEIIKKA